MEELIELDSLLGTGYQIHEMEAMRRLTDTPAAPGDFDVWPTLCIQMNPETKNAYYQMTPNAGGDTERFELLMKLAGWTP